MKKEGGKGEGRKTREWKSGGYFHIFQDVWGPAAMVEGSVFAEFCACLECRGGLGGHAGEWWAKEVMPT